AVRRAHRRAGQRHRRAGAAGHREGDARAGHGHAGHHPQRADRRDGAPRAAHGGRPHRRGPRERTTPAGIVADMVKALDVKLWRDLKRLAAQGATIALVVACGVAGFVGMFSTHRTLVDARDAYYRDARFADVFASVRRAPLSLRERIAGIDGVTEVRLDTAFDTQLDLTDVLQPVTGRLIGLDIGRPQGLNRLTVTAGR